MMRSGYTIAAWPTFMLKRLVRLEPPYLVSIALILAFGALDMHAGHRRSGPRRRSLAISAMQTRSSVSPGSTRSTGRWPIEFQFYVLMGVALPLLMLARTPERRLAGLALASCLPLLLPGRSNATILPFLPVFAAGTLTFLPCDEDDRSAELLGGARCPGGDCVQEARRGRRARDHEHGGPDRHRSHSAGRAHRLARRDLLLALSAARAPSAIASATRSGDCPAAS